MSIFDVPLAEIRDPNELAHFGVKGMKWGQRRAKKRSEIKARIAKQGDAKISLMYDKNSPQHYVNGTFGTGTLRARGLSKALIRSKGARRKALGRAIVIQKARSNRRWKNTPLARAVGSTSNARFRDRYKAARKAWKRDRQDYNYAGNRGGVFGEYVRQRRRQRK